MPTPIKKVVSLTVPSDQNYVSVTFDNELPDVNYQVLITPEDWIRGYWITNKTSTGFKVTFDISKLTVSGTINPNVTGVYTRTTDYGGMPRWVLNSYYIRYNSGWEITNGSNGWTITVPSADDPTGEYGNGTGGATGNPTVALAGVLTPKCEVFWSG